MDNISNKADDKLFSNIIPYLTLLFKFFTYEECGKLL